ncbi:MAG: hypothetical protein K0S04_2588 [Herbinix sp.]|jgi:hypothetical protein|nr:hypothetical protein [Herbinix sp.]
MSNKLKLLKKENKLREQSLSTESSNAILKIMEYMSAARMGAFDREITHKELIGMALEAEQRNETFSEIIEGDIKEWCETVIENSGKISKKEFLLVVAYDLAIRALFLSIVFFVIHTDAEVVSVYESIFFLTWLVIGTAGQIYLRPRFLYEKGWKKHIYNFLLTFILILSAVVNWHIPFLKSALFRINTLWIAGVAFTVFLLVKVAYDYYIICQSKKYKWTD